MSDDVKRMDEKYKAAFLEIEKRLVNLESSIEVVKGLQKGNLTPAQEQRVSAVEERLENVEDLQMLANLDLIKLKETVEKLTPGSFVQSGQPIGSNVLFLEDKLKEIESRISGKTITGTDTEIKNEIKSLKEDLESFKKETEESIKIIVGSIKKIAEKMGR